MKPATAAAEPHAVVELVPLDKIAEDPGNPRRTFTGIEELADSIRQHGVIVPVLVRPMPGIGSNLLTLVCGARRYRAAKLAGLEAIPAMRRELGDIEALEIQIVENLNRPDVHPMEEAEGYQRLLDSPERKYSVDDIAAKVGKSKAYVYGRLKLLALCKEAREAFYAGKFTASSALAVARVTDHGTQRAILKDLSHYREDGAWSAYDVSQIVRKHLCRLAEAPFSKDDPALVSGAGPCSLCSKRSGAQPELFADVAKQDGDLCIDPACYQRKKDAAWEKRAVEAQAKGLTVVEGKAAEKVLRGNDYVRLDKAYYQDPKYRTLKQLVGKVAKDRVVLARDEDGDVRELVPKSELKKLLKEAGHNFKAERAGSPSRRRGVTASEKEAAALRDVVHDRCRVLAVAAFAKKEPDRDLWLLILDAHRVLDDGVVDAALPGKIDEKEGPAKEKRIQAAIAKLTEKELRGLAIAAVLSSMLPPFGYGPNGTKVLKWTGIDPKKVEAEVKAQCAAATKTETWSLTPNARSVPQWVRDVTGIGTVAALEKKYGPGAKFEKGVHPEPRQITDLVGTREEATARHGAKKSGKAARS